LLRLRERQHALAPQALQLALEAADLVCAPLRFGTGMGRHAGFSEPAR
jgi:hypothetical protein